MTLEYLPLIGLYTLFVIWVLSFTYLFYKKITCMVGMMIAMTMGMTIGLFIGTVTGTMYPEYFFQTTIFSMLVGAVFGVMSGYPISIMAVLDGLLSGIMGGMMGAMLGSMIPALYQDSIIKVMFVLSIGILFILFLMIQNEIKFKDTEKGWKTLLFSRPQPMFLLTCVILFLVHQSQFSFAQEKSNIDHKQMTHNQTQPDQMDQLEIPSTLREEKIVKTKGHNSHTKSDDRKNTQKDKPVGTVTIEADEFVFTPNNITFKKGESINIVFKNSGKVEHDFEVVGTDIHIHAQPGTIEKASFSIDKPGKYEAICTLPGHQEAGMISTVEVF
jgi:heme/copper-type cytochrome/quinol oxidase subunit 2